MSLTLLALTGTGVELGAEPPAVVNLLVTRCGLSPDAADATLLDLAARRILELHQPGRDPADLLVRTRRLGPPITLACILTGMALACLGILPLQRTGPRRPAAAQAQAGAATVARNCVAASSA